MNSFETDLKRGIFSIPFGVGMVLELIILFTQGFEADMYKVSVPVIASLPYSMAWLMDYQSGYIKFYVSRVGISKYIFGKIFACGISGGALGAMAVWIYKVISKNSDINIQLIFMSFALWAIVAATLAAWSNSRYIAYGGGFVIYYILVILHQRYFGQVYCLDPYEWFNPKQSWMFDTQGIMILIGGLMIIFVCIYYLLVRRCIENV